MVIQMIPGKVGKARMIDAKSLKSIVFDTN